MSSKRSKKSASQDAENTESKSSGIPSPKADDWGPLSNDSSRYDAREKLEKLFFQSQRLLFQTQPSLHKPLITDDNITYE